MTPEQIQAAEKFTAEMVAVVRRRLFAGVPEKEWFQHLNCVRQAVMEPARYLRERGAALPGSRYREILLGCLKTIETHGRLDVIRRKAQYFLHCVQEHMKKQGDGYYEAGKTPRNASVLVDRALKAMRPRAEAVDLTEHLAASVAVLRSKGGRKKSSPRGIQRELF